MSLINAILEQLLNGLRTGSIYALIALGYTMVYGIAKMINFAHGDIIMVGAYTLYVCVSLLHLHPILAVIITILVCALLGVVIEKIAYKPLRQAPPLAVLITAIGVSYLLQNLALLIFKATPIPFASIIKVPSIKIGGVHVSGLTIVTLIVTTISMILLTLFINKTKAGRAMRAVSEDKGSSRTDGRKCQSDDLHHLCCWFGSCGCGRSSFHCPVRDLASYSGSSSRNQSFRGSCFRWYRKYSGSHAWRIDPGDH